MRSRGEGKPGLTARGVHARTRGTFNGSIATLAYSDGRAPASDFRATIHWGNGHVTHGKIAGRDGTFHVHGTQYFTRAGLHRVRVSISGPDGTSPTANSDVTVLHHHAAAKRPRRRITLPRFTG